jgi:hypothetical protein
MRMHYAAAGTAVRVSSFVGRRMRLIDVSESLDFRPLEDAGVAARTPSGGIRETVGRILASQNYRRAQDYFRNYPAHSLLFDSSRAFLYELVRETRPNAVLEIGTYRAGTTEVLARVLWPTNTESW